VEDLFTFEAVTSETHYDLWVLNLKSDGSKRLTITYQMGFTILSDILLACKMAMCYEQVASKHWREFAKLTTWREEAEDAEAVHPIYRRSRELPNVKAYNVAYENNLVRLEFFPEGGGDMLTAKIHFSDAFKLYRGGRIACRTSKHWAGDTSRIYSGRAHLADAEDNDKLIVQ